MPVDLPIRCACGTLRGVARLTRRHRVDRAVCYCRDCRCFARFLGQARTVLDAHGGTEVLQMSQGHLRITAGAARIACIRLRPHGLLRWHAACCNTPIGNTLVNRHIPYLGLIRACMGPAPDAPPLDTLLGPVSLRVHGRHFIGDRGQLEIAEGIPLSALLRSVTAVAWWRLRGEHDRSPFFDPATGRPVIAPRVLGEAERRALLEADRTQPPCSAPGVSADDGDIPPGGG